MKAQQSVAESQSSRLRHRQWAWDWQRGDCACQFVGVCSAATGVVRCEDARVHSLFVVKSSKNRKNCCDAATSASPEPSVFSVESRFNYAADRFWPMK